MEAPPEVLQWARTTLRGISAIEEKAQWHGLKVDPEVMAALHKIERQVIEFLDTYKSTDPAKWVSPE
jgi:hypothetical protein